MAGSWKLMRSAGMSAANVTPSSAKCSAVAPHARSVVTESGAAHLQSAIERLEQRIAELENPSSSQPPHEIHEPEPHAAHG